MTQWLNNNNNNKLPHRNLSQAQKNRISDGAEESFCDINHQINQSILIHIYIIPILYILQYI